MELAAGGPAGDEVMVPAPVVAEERTGTPLSPSTGLPLGTTWPPHKQNHHRKLL